jgi:thiol-disulfide isomerase/thioredoxin
MTDNFVRYLLLGTLLASAVGPAAERLINAETPTPQRAPVTLQLPSRGTMPSLGGATEWLNSSPLSTEGLRGKVVLVEFWTFTCINWRRTLPYVRAWADKYKDQGLVVIGVHTPEFEVEKDVANIRQAIRDMQIGFPIAVDSRYGVWEAFGNQYWPALYFVDARGQIRHHQFGEGEYEQSERVLQQLLTEAGHTDFDHQLVTVEG